MCRAGDWGVRCALPIPQLRKLLYKNRYVYYITTSLSSLLPTGHSPPKKIDVKNTYLFDSEPARRQFAYVESPETLRKVIRTNWLNNFRYIHTTSIFSMNKSLAYSQKHKGLPAQLLTHDGTMINCSSGRLPSSIGLMII